MAAMATTAATVSAGMMIRIISLPSTSHPPSEVKPTEFR